MSDQVLVLGASGATGSALLRLLAPASAGILAWSRRAVAADASLPAVEWRVGDVFEDPLPVVDAILSAGPIDGLVAALSRSPGCTPRAVVALSSSSAAFKRESPDAGERALAATLANSEAALGEHCRARGARCVILRPTLIYGGHDDGGAFGAVMAQARRFGRVVLPASARGLRMPIQAEDLAATMLNALQAGEATGVFDVGGGETLAYGAMLERVLRARGTSAPVFHVPDALFRVALRGAHAIGMLRGLGVAMVLRMRDDLVVDDTPARKVLGHAPGPFRPGGHL